MAIFSFLARATTFINPRVGLTLASLIGSLGATVAAVIVSRRFVGFLSRSREAHNLILEQYKRAHAESQRTFQEELGRLSDRHQNSQHEFQAYITRISDTQTFVLRDVIVAMNFIEDGKGCSPATLHGVKTTIGRVETTVHAIDFLLGDLIDEHIITTLPGQNES